MVKLPFDQIPTGGEIARHFVGSLSQLPQGYDGFDLWRDGEDYCYVWRLAQLDLDYEGAWLLEVRTHNGGEETRDLLFVWLKDGRVECEWRNTPVNVFCPADEMRDYLREGYAWFHLRSSQNLI